MTTAKIFLIGFLLVCMIWYMFSSTSPFTHHVFYRAKYFRLIPTNTDIPVLEVTFEREGKDFVLRKSAEFMSDEEYILIWTAINFQGECPLLIHIKRNLWNKWAKRLEFSIEPALITDGSQHG